MAEHQQEQEQHDGDDERPMTEAEWEAQFRESEARSARYGDLFETLLDHPDRDEIINHEMGWDGDDDDEDEEDWDPEREAWEDEKAEIIREAEAAMNDPEERAAIEAEMRRESEELENMPAYRVSFDTGLKVHEAVTPHLNGHIDDEGESIDEIGEHLQEASANALIPAAKIAGGHGIGYDDDVLCGNIVCCKRARDAAQQCVEALTWLGEREVLPTATAAELRADMQHVVQVIDERIAELRTRVWWE